MIVRNHINCPWPPDLATVSAGSKADAGALGGLGSGLGGLGGLASVTPGHLSANHADSTTAMTSADRQPRPHNACFPAPPQTTKGDHTANQPPQWSP